MDNYQATIKFSVMIFMLLSPITLSIAFDLFEGNGGHPIVKSLCRSWDKVKSLLQEAQNIILPPNLDFRIQEKDGVSYFESGDSKERIKMAAKTSFKEGEATLEKTAESAATAMEHAVHKAKDKVEHKLAHGHLNDADEL